jgi:metal-responsive CopG/Arc/MetJ family transcriptional regulator
MANVETAIWLQESLLAQAEELACELKVSRSRLFELALENFIQERQDRTLFEQINSACENVPPDETEQQYLRQSLQLHRRLVKGNW